MRQTVFRLFLFTYFSHYGNLSLQTAMVITSKYDRFKGKINGIYEYDFHFNSRSDCTNKSNKIKWLPWIRIIKLEENHIFMRMKLKSLPNSKITDNVLKVPLFTASSYARLVGYSSVVT